MSIFDLCLLGFIGISGLFGLTRGLTREFLGLVAWGFAVVLGYIFSPYLRHFARSYISNHALADATTLFITFLVFLIILSLISHLLSNMVRQSALGGIDRTLGLAFGFLRGVVLIFILEQAVNVFMPREDYPSMVQTSRFYDFIIKGSNTVYNLLPRALEEVIQEQKMKRTPKNGSAQVVSVPLGGSGVRIQASPSSIMQTPISMAQKANELANLKPRVDVSTATEQPKNYSKSQKNSLDRMLDQTSGDAIAPSQTAYPQAIESESYDGAPVSSAPVVNQQPGQSF